MTDTEEKDKELIRTSYLQINKQPSKNKISGWLELLYVCLPRLTRILTRLPALRLMNSSITEELFFTGLIGNVSIDSIIPYILKMETAEYNSQDSDPTEWHASTSALRTVDLKVVLSLSLKGFCCWTPVQKPAAAPCFLTMHDAKSFRYPW